MRSTTTLRTFIRATSERPLCANSAPSSAAWRTRSIRPIATLPPLAPVRQEGARSGHSGCRCCPSQSSRYRQSLGGVLLDHSVANIDSKEIRHMKRTALLSRPVGHRVDGFTTPDPRAPLPPGRWLHDARSERAPLVLPASRRERHLRSAPGPKTRWAGTAVDSGDQWPGREGAPPASACLVVQAATAPGG